MRHSTIFIAFLLKKFYLAFAKVLHSTIYLLLLHSGSTKFLGQRLIWKTWAPLRVKIFLWLAFRRRHWTADCRARHGLAREQCYLCDQATETIDHIIACCPYTREVWHHICQALGRQLPPATPTIHTFWRRLRSLWTGQQQQGLDTYFSSSRLYRGQSGRKRMLDASRMPTPR